MSRCGRAWRDPIAKRTYGLFDLLVAGSGFIESQTQAFRDNTDFNTVNAGKPCHGILDFGCTGSTVHAGDRPVAGSGIF